MVSISSPYVASVDKNFVAQDGMPYATVDAHRTKLYLKRKHILYFAIVALVLHAGLGQNPSAMVRIWKTAGVLHLPEGMEEDENLLNLQSIYYERALTMSSLVDMFVGGIAPFIDEIFHLGPRGMVSSIYLLLAFAYVLWIPFSRPMYNTGTTLCIAMACSGAVKVVSLHGLLWISSYFTNHMTIMAGLTGLQELSCGAPAVMAFIIDIASAIDEYYEGYYNITGLAARCLILLLISSAFFLGVLAMLILPSSIQELNSGEREALNAEMGRSRPIQAAKEALAIEQSTEKEEKYQMHEVEIRPSNTLRPEGHTMKNTFNVTSAQMSLSSINNHEDGRLPRFSVPGLSHLGEESICSAQSGESALTVISRYSRTNIAIITHSCSPLSEFESPYSRSSTKTQLLSPTFILYSAIYMIQYAVQYKFNIIYPLVFQAQGPHGEKMAISSEWLLMLGILPSLLISGWTSITRFRFVGWFFVLHMLLFACIVLMRFDNSTAQWASFACFLVVNDPIQYAYFQCMTELFGHKSLPVLTGVSQFASGILFVSAFGLHTPDLNYCKDQLLIAMLIGFVLLFIATFVVVDPALLVAKMHRKRIAKRLRYSTSRKGTGIEMS